MAPQSVPPAGELGKGPGSEVDMKPREQTKAMSSRYPNLLKTLAATQIRATGRIIGAPSPGKGGCY